MYDQTRSVNRPVAPQADESKGDMKSTFRNAIAASFRALPRFRGKSYLGAATGRFLTSEDNEEDPIATVRMLDGSLMLVDVRSRTEQWAYWTGDYDHNVISKLSACLRERCVVFDVGANVGFYSVSLGNKLKPLNGTLHAFEPVRSNFDRLIRSVELNNLERVVAAHNVALGDEEGTIEMSMENDRNASTGNAVMVKGKITGKLGSNTNARITRLDDFAREKQIQACHLIKIDVEGAEVMFLRGGSDFLGEHRPIIYGEFSAYWLEQFGHSFVDAANIVAPWGYRLFRSVTSRQNMFKQSGHARFTEFEHPEVGIEDVLLVPSDTPRSVLTSLGINA